ncbi:NADP oxidoreductase [Deltaproteobacteria bacterium]|nr:NADP oxidoreductase [Deltaproteobacteria bacterium]
MAAPPSITIVGPGRLGRSVAGSLRRAGWAVTTVGRGEEAPKGASLIWLTVPDHAVAARARTLPPGALVLHSAGSLGPEVLAPHRGAVLHPLMTFPHPEGAFVPCTASGHPEALVAAHEVAAALGWRVLGEVHDRARYHAAACMASGHIAACFADASVIFASATGVSEAEARRTLEPLAAATLARVVVAGSAAITGPAARGDEATIAAHRAVLPADSLALYDAGTRTIKKLQGG